MFIIAYSLFRHFTGIGLDEEHEIRMMNIVIFTAIGIFIYNRKLAQDEKRARDAAKNEEFMVEKQLTNESLPHWERNKNDVDSKGDSD